MDKNFEGPSSNEALVSCLVFGVLFTLVIGQVVSVDSPEKSDRKPETSAVVTTAVNTEPYAVTTTADYRNDFPEITTQAEYTGEYYPQGDNYNIGNTIPEGYYILIYNGYPDVYGDAYWGTYAAPDGEESNSWFQYSSIVKLEGHGYFEMSWCDAYPLEKYTGENNPFEHSGMFRVGVDVEAGTYKVLSPYEDEGLKSELAVHEDIDSIDYEKIYMPDSYEVEEVTLHDGEILEMRFCVLEKNS